MAEITLDLPEWAEERHVAVMAGMELVAYRPYGKNVWYVKTARCNSCGVCCHMLSPAYPIENTDNVCNYLVKIGQIEECSKVFYRPWACCWSDPVLLGLQDAESYCSIRYKIVEIVNGDKD